MALVLLGKKYYDYTNEKGQRFQGVKLHCIQQNSTPAEGTLTEVVSVGSNKPIYATVESFPFETVITPIYNRYGRVDDIVVVSYPGDGKK